MHARNSWKPFLAAVLLLLISCSLPATGPATAPVTTRETATFSPADTALPTPAAANMPNPASVYCEEQGNRLEIRTDDDGNQSGVCILPDGSECDEWAYFRGECGFSGLTPQPTTEAVNGWRIYRDEVLGYRFEYPADAEIFIADEPQRSLIISGPGMGGESWVISHPSARDEFRPPEGVDLSQWLTEHYLVGEQRMPDTQIAGTLAIHFRHERSPQSYADDRYYFASSGQLYMILIGHGETEDWELNNRFLQSFQFDGPSDHQGWWTYTHPVYGFSIMLPDGWVVNEVTSGDPLMNGHMLILGGQVAMGGTESIRMTFRRTGEDVPLWPTGVGPGEFVKQGTLEVAGAPVRRVLLVCPGSTNPNGDITAIWYHGSEEGQANIVRGNLEFGFIFRTESHCEPGHSLSAKVQHTGEMIIASLKVP